MKQVTEHKFFKFKYSQLSKSFDMSPQMCQTLSPLKSLLHQSLEVCQRMSRCKPSRGWTISVRCARSCLIFQTSCHDGFKTKGLGARESDTSPGKSGAKALSSKTSPGGPFGQFRHFQRKSVYLTFFGPLQGRKTRFGKFWETRPRSFFLISQNLSSIFLWGSVAT